jgi:hypothetical protein
MIIIILLLDPVMINQACKDFYRVQAIQLNKLMISVAYQCCKHQHANQ